MSTFQPEALVRLLQLLRLSYDAIFLRDST
jgi:hypothetical protein